MMPDDNSGLTEAEAHYEAGYQAGYEARADEIAQAKREERERIDRALDRCRLMDLKYFDSIDRKHVSDSCAFGNWGYPYPCTCPATSGEDGK